MLLTIALAAVFQDAMFIACHWITHLALAYLHSSLLHASLSSLRVIDDVPDLGALAVSEAHPGARFCAGKLLTLRERKFSQGSDQGISGTCREINYSQGRSHSRKPYQAAHQQHGVCMHQVWVPPKVHIP